MAFIEQLGVRNLIVEARETTESQAYQKVRQLSAGPHLPGLPGHAGDARGHHGVDAAQALHAVEAAAEAAARSCRSSTASARRTSTIAQSEVSRPAASSTKARPRTRRRSRARARRAAAALFGADDPIGQFVKVNEQWFQVIGVAGPQLTRADRRRPVCPRRIGTT